MKYPMDLHLAPPRTEAEVRAMVDNASEDVMATFAATCRQELGRLR